MDTRRVLQFCLLSCAMLLIWQQLIAVFPALGPLPPAIVAQPEDTEEVAGKAELASDAAEVDLPAADANAGDETPVSEAVPDFPAETIKLGSPDPKSGYFLDVTLLARGAAVGRINLNDEMYRDLKDRDRALAIVGGKDAVPAKTFAVMASEPSPELASADLTLATVNWEVVESDIEHAVFRLPAIGAQPELIKTFRVQKGGDREEDATGYFVDVTLEARNDSGEAATFDYSWQGPVSVPLENVDHTRTFVELKAGVVEPGDDDVDVVVMYAKDIVEEYDDAASRGEPGNVTRWRDPMHFVGIDAQYFTAMVTGAEAGKTIDWIQEVVPDYVERATLSEHSDITIRLEAKPMPLAAGASATHAMRAYFGPKRSHLVDAFGGGDLIAFGWFGSISRVMLAVLGFFHHSLGLPYALAIMLLTCCVRGLMTPISLKQAQQGKKMKEMQPKVAKLQEKYGDDKEGLMKAQMQLYRDEDFNMLAGCFPIFLQFPIFIGLYQALYNAIDLRLAEFLWIDNLAAPDHLFAMPFSIPHFGSWFNLLPIVTCFLFIFQQKMFMPPPTTDEQAMQQKLMKYMMVFMGAIFYHVPAGLCLYFIASSAWGMTERTLIDRDIIKLPKKKKKEKKPRETPTWMQRMLDAADQAKQQS